MKYCFILDFGCMKEMLSAFSCAKWELNLWLNCLFSKLSGRHQAMIHFEIQFHAWIWLHERNAVRFLMRKMRAKFVFEFLFFEIIWWALGHNKLWNPALSLILAAWKKCCYSDSEEHYQTFEVHLASASQWAWGNGNVYMCGITTVISNIQFLSLILTA